MKEMLLVKHSLLLARRHNRSFQLNTDRRFDREWIYPLPVFWQTTEELLFDIELCSAKHVSRHGINKKLKISTCKIKNFGLTNKGHMVYPFWEVKRETRKTAKILFALHYIRTGCEINSTNWAGDAIQKQSIYLRAWGRAAGSGSGYGFERKLWNNCIHEYVVKRKMSIRFTFRHICGTVYVSQVCLFYCKNMDGTEGRNWEIPM